LPALLFGVAVGNLVRGVPLTVTETPTLGAQVEYAGTFFTLLNPYALLVGLLGLAAIVRHGAAWAALKTGGALQMRARKAHALGLWVFLIVLLGATVATAFVAPDHFHNNTARVAGWVAIAVLLLGLAVERLSRAQQSDWGAFLGSAASLAALVGLWAVGNYPNLVPSLGNPHNNLTVAGSASSNLTLTAMLIITAVGLPLVLAYTVLVYRVFRGKVQAGEGAPGAY
jgi:cytochrome d ubiquinol oxidase subunit II